MVHLPYLQPFEDVNKRVSRLAANIPLFKRNLCPLSFLDVPTRAYVDALLGVYELNRIELLRDVFIWAYERSCQQYVAVRSQMVPPDTFRLRYRAALAEAVRAIIRNDTHVNEQSIRPFMPQPVVAEDAARFTPPSVGRIPGPSSGKRGALWIATAGVRSLERCAPALTAALVRALTHDFARHSQDVVQRVAVTIHVQQRAEPRCVGTAIPTAHQVAKAATCGR